MALLLFSEQEAFRERRPLIRNAGLVADEHDALLETLGAEGRGGLKPALPSANNDDGHEIIVAWAVCGPPGRRTPPSRGAGSSGGCWTFGARPSSRASHPRLRRLASAAGGSFPRRTRGR